MSNNQKKKADVGLIVMILVVIAVLVLGGLAVAPKVKTAIEARKAEKVAELVMNGQATIDDYAPIYAGMSADEFISTYGLKGKVTKDSLMTEAEEKMTLKNFCKYAGMEYTDEALEGFKAEYEAEMAEAPDEEKVEITADTTDIAIKAAFAQYLSMGTSSPEGVEVIDTETVEGEVPEENVEETEPVADTE